MIDWLSNRRIKTKIARTEHLLEQLYEERKAAIETMENAGMTQREIGAWWGITNPRVNQILRGTKK